MSISILLLLSNIVLVAWVIRRFILSPFTAYSFSLLCYGVVFFGGITFVAFMDIFIGYKMPLDQLMTIEIYSVVGLIVFVLSKMSVDRVAVLLVGVAPRSLVLKQNSASGTALLALALLSMLATLVLIAANGLGFGAAGYEIRYEESRGFGWATVLLPSYLPYLTYRLLFAGGRREFVVAGCLGIAYSLVIYLTLNGYRQLVMATLLLFVLIAFVQGRVSKLWIVIGVAVFFPVVLTSLAFLRYMGESDPTFSNSTVAALYYLQGDLFPIDAPLKIFADVNINGSPGFSVAISHFFRFVPRFIWEDKPDISLNAAGFYTQMVIGYGRGVTLSPTIMGEGFLIDVRWGFLLVMTLAGAFSAFYDLLLLHSRSLIVRCVLLSFVYFGFFMVREGFEAAIYRFVVAIVFCLMALAFYAALDGLRRNH